MRVLVTGHRGMIGQAVEQRLRADGHDVMGLDRSRRDDVCKLDRVRRRAEGCDVVVHAAAIPNNKNGTPDEIMRVNLLGTHNVVSAAAEVGARVVHVSSIQALGLVEGDDRPRYVPIDDNYPPEPRRAYGVSKLLGEELCAAFTRRTGLTSICLRPVGVWDGERTARMIARRADDDTGWGRWWELGAFVDLRDFVDAVVLALTADVAGAAGHARLLVAADDSAIPRPTLELLERLHPEVPVRDAESFVRDPYRSLVDSSGARRMLGWQPVHTWRVVSRADAPR